MLEVGASIKPHASSSLLLPLNFLKRIHCRRPFYQGRQEEILLSMQWKAALSLGDLYSCTRLRCGSQPDLCTKHNIQLHHLKFQSFVSPFQWLFGHWHFSVKTSLWNQKGLWGEPWGAGRQTMILSTLQSANSLLQTMGSLTWQGHQSFQRRELRDFPFLQQLQCKIQDKDGQKASQEAEWSMLVLSCSVICDPMDWILPSSSVHGILQARILEWVATAFSRGSSQPRNWTQVSCIADRFFTIWVTREALNDL